MTDTLAKKAAENAMMALMGKYDQFFGDGADKRRRIANYWEILRLFDGQVITKACRRASEPDYYPDKFPNAGQLMRICQHVALELGMGPARTEISAPPSGSPEPVWDPENPFHQLGMRWQKENRARLAGDTSQQETGKSRAAELKELWNEHTGAEAPLPIPEPPPAPQTPQPPGDDCPV